MARKKKSGVMTSGDLPALRLGSRVRFRDDGAEGRIVWANAASVKIQWDDGEEVTWRRDALADKPIDILDPDHDAGADPRPEEAPVSVASEPAAAEQEAAAPPAPEEPVAVEPSATAADATAAEKPQAEGAPPPDAGTSEATDTPAQAKPKRERKPKAPAEPKGKRLSALDAAAKVLAEEGRAMSCQELIAAMAARGYWTSPKGATPAATLYSAMLRELQTKGASARFRKTERGKFARNGTA